MTYFLRLVTAPAIEPVTIDEAKEQCQQDGSADNALLTRLIKAARSYIEQETGRALITQTWEAVFGEWPAAEYQPDYDSDFANYPTIIPGPIAVDAVEIVKMPFGAISSVTAGGSAWSGYTSTRTARGVKIKRSGSAPAGEVVVTFTAGYGTSAATVPSDLSHALLMLVATLYDNRGSLTVTPKDMAIAAANTPGCMDTIHRYRVMT